MSIPVPEPRSLRAWAEVLDRIEAALDATLAEAVEVPASAPPGGEAPEERQGVVQDCLDRAERGAAEADALLAAEAEALEGWLRALAGVRERLAGGRGRAP